MPRDASITIASRVSIRGVGEEAKENRRVVNKAKEMMDANSKTIKIKRNLSRTFANFKKTINKAKVHRYSGKKILLENRNAKKKGNMSIFK